MKKIVFLIVFLLTIFCAYRYRENIYEMYYDNFVPIEDKVSKLEKNNYYRDYDFSYVQNVEKFVPSNKKDILNMYYTIVNSGMNEFTFYCPDEYKDCLDDVNDLANDQNAISNINNFVHPYNSFKTLKTETDTTGKVYIQIEKVYDEEMIIILNYKVDDIIKETITNSMDTKTKIKKIHDYIINNASYDKERSDNKVVNYKSDNAYGVLIENHGLCGGYTDAMMLFLEKLKIPNYKISSENHVWNYVYVDGEWLHLDLTWDDPVTNDGKNVLDSSFFLVNDKELSELEKEEHIFNADIYEPKSK